MSFDQADTQFHVVVNAEQQYSIWPEYKSIPAGWQEIGVSGDRQTCLAHISGIWSDMRPRSLREAMTG
ncbi:MbtH family protein [Azotobacter sp. CWF10]|uniref:Antibiotic synthesis protein MbtH-like n=1 Tax=Azotobacter chroococcum NCIMB 8003 TaxID=1328314 RepID=A0A0C4WTD3_9GAMM|nr:MbtH family NRPS accessory protein [Azotobacter chroococcum]AJE23909.1 Antibiotic synthesis protein MbtH-like [Azotobacter chroococcum NCIMB 8003]